MPGAGFLDAAISSSIMVLIPISSCTESTRLDAPSSSCTTATKLNCLQSPLFPLDRGGYGKIGDCEKSTTKHDTSQISSFILFHCLEPKRFLGFSTVGAAQGSWESFKNAKAQGKAQCDHDTLRRDFCRKSQEARGYEAASSYGSWELMAKKLMSNGFSYDKDIFANVPSFGKFQARLLELHTKES